MKRIRQGEPTYGAERANILCRRHNSMLSPLDATVGRLAKFQAAANDKAFEESLILEGELLERWLLKTVVNSAAAGWAAPVKWQPAPNVVRAIYGLEAVPERIGLYSVDGVDPNHRPSGGVSFTPIHLQTSRGKVLGGAYVSVHGMPLFASFNTDLAEVLETRDVQSLPQFSSGRPRHLYHPGAIVMSRKEGKPVFIGLSWGGVVRYADGSTVPFPRRPQT